MSHTNDVQFVLNEEKLFHKMTRASNEEELQLNEVIEKNKSDKWKSPKPWIRVFCCVLEEVLTACRGTNNWENRKGADGKKTVSRPKPFFELGCGYFNNPSLRAISNQFPDFHDQQ